MALNFSEFLEGFVEPQYQSEGKEPKCPEGSKWDKKLGTCVPSGKWTVGDKECPQDLANYNVIGSDGLNGAPPAMAVEEEMQYHRTAKDEKRLEDADRKNKEQDNRMKFGKSGKEPAPLRKGEVKKWSKELGRYVSNKE